MVLRLRLGRFSIVWVFVYLELFDCLSCSPRGAVCVCVCVGGMVREGATGEGGNLS